MYEAFLAAFCIALLSLIGVFIFGPKERIRGLHRYILPIAIGVFLGIVFFELIPETIEMSEEYGPIMVAIGFLGFYLLTQIIDTYHHHGNSEAHHSKSSATKLLIGDAIHNIADGVTIASAFFINPALGIATTVGIALHEIPQEIVEFGVLLHAGYTKKKAAVLNFVSALSIVLGVLFTIFFAATFADMIWILTGLAAGNLLYIAATDLLPELQETHKGHFRDSFLLTLFGLIAVGILFELVH